MTTHDTPGAALRWALNRAEQRELEALAELDEKKAEIERLREALAQIAEVAPGYEHDIATRALAPSEPEEKP